MITFRIPTFLFLFGFFIFSSPILGQVFQEDFSGYATGTMNNAPTWTSSFTDCDDGASINTGNNFWGTNSDLGGNTFFEINDIEGSNCTDEGSGIGGNNVNTLMFNDIDISATGCVIASVDVSSSGTFECSFPLAPNYDPIGSYSGHDQLVVEYSVDAGPWTLFENGGYVCGDNGLPTVITTNTVVGNNIQIRIVAGNQSNSEHYYINSVEVNNSSTTSNSFDNPGDQTECDSYTLPTITGNNLTGNEAYFTGPGGTGMQFNAGDDITSSTTLYIFDPSAPCSDEEMFMVTIHPSPDGSAPNTSLNICFDIGPPTTWSENSAVIIDEITGGDPTVTVDIFYDDMGLNPIDYTTPGGIAILVATDPSVVYASVSNANCTIGFFEIVINIEEAPPGVDGELEECPNGGTAVFDPTDADSQFDNGGTSTVSYHNTQTDAVNGDAPITGTISTTVDLTIFVRVVTAAGCIVTSELDLTIISGPTANDATVEACDDGSGQGIFDLTSAESDILNGSGSVTFYTDMAATNMINNPSTYMSGAGTVYAVVTASGCTSEPAEVTLSLISFDETEASIAVSPNSLCGSGDVTMTLTAPSSPSGSYTFNVSYGPTGGPYTTTDFTGVTGDMPLTITVSEDYEFILNSISTTGTNICTETSTQAPVEVTVGGSPTANSSSLTVCDDGTGQGDFDLTAIENDVNGGSGLPVLWFEDMAATIPIGDPTSFVNIPTTVYAVVNGGVGCTSAPVEVDLLLEQEPVISISATPTSACGDTDVTITFNLPPGEAFDIEFQLTSPTNPGLFNYDNIFDGHMETFSISSSTLFEVLFVTTELTCEFSPLAFVNVNLETPPTANTASLSTCSSTGVGIFDLTSLDETVNGNTGHPVSWFEDMAGTISINPAFNYASSGGTIYAQVNNGSCLSELVAVTLTLEGGPSANTASLEDCDEGGGQANFDLTSVNNTVNGATGLTVQWFEDMAATIPISNPVSYASSTGVVYANVVDGDCTSSIVQINLTVNDLPATNPAALEECDNGTGQATFDLTSVDGTVNNGTTNTVSWFEDIATTTPIGAPGSYSSGTGTVYASVFDGTCTSDAVEVDLTVLPLPNAMTASIEDCNAGGGTATFNLTTLETTVNGNTGNTVNWFSDAGALSPISAPANFQTGSTTVFAVVTDGTCFSAPVAITITVSDAVSASSTTLSLCGNALGEATFDLTTIEDIVNENTGNNVSWYENQTATISINSPNAYTSSGETIYAIVDDGTCFSATTPVTLEVNTAPTANSTSIDGCDNGFNQAIFDLTTLEDFINDNTGLAVEWSFDPDMLDLINNPANFTTDLSAIYATVLGADCNSETVQIILNIVPGPTLDLTIDQAISCSGADDGSLALDVTGTPNFTFDWNDDNLDGIQNPASLQPGIYTVTVTDGNNCSAETDIELTEPSFLDLNCAESMAVSIPNGSDGEAEITIIGGIPNYTLDWSGAAVGSQMVLTEGVTTISGLVAGNYTLTITDGNNCTNTCAFSISAPGCTISAALETTNPICNDSDDGTINVIVQNNNGAIQYDWTDDQYDGMSMLTDLTPGNYSVIVTDAAGCSTSTSTTIVAPAAIVLTCTAIDQQSVNINIENGTPVFTIQQSTGPTVIPAQDFNNGDNLVDNLSSGDYTLTIDDDNDCSATCAFTIPPPNCDVTVDLAAAPILCNGDSTNINVTVTNATPIIQYDWSDNQYDGMDNLTNVPAGIYELVVTDGNNCTASGMINITQPEALAINCSVANQPSSIGASDGELSIDIQGGTAAYTISYSSSPTNSGTMPGSAGTNNISGLIAGVYTIIVTDENDCTSTCMVTLSDPGCDLEIMLEGQNLTCFDDDSGSINLTINTSQAIVTIDWSDDNLDGLEDPQNLMAGVYSVTVTDGGNCVESGTVALTSVPEIMVDCSDITEISTPGANDGAVNILISEGVPTYAVNLTGPVNTTTNLNADGSVSFSSLLPGTYMVEVIDANDCVSTCTFNLNDPSCMFEVMTSSVDVLCNEDSTGSITFTLINGSPLYTFNWSDDQYDSMGSNGDLTNIPAGIYQVTVTDANMCSDADTIVITEPIAFDFACSANQNASQNMNDGSINIEITSNVSPPFSINYVNTDTNASGNQVGMFGDNLITGLGAGTYEITVSNDAGCGEVCIINVQEDVDCNISLSFEVNDLSCADADDGSVIVIAENGTLPYEYLWSNDAITDTIENLAAGLYFVTVTDAENCEAVAVANVGVSPTTADITFGDGDLICPGECFELPVTVNETLPATLTYVISTPVSTTVFTQVLNAVNSTVVICPLQIGVPEGDFTFIGTMLETSNCTFTFTEARDFNYLPVASGSFDTTICSTDTLTIAGEEFHLGNTTGNVLIPNATANGCDSLVHVTVDFFPEISSDFATTICLGDTLTMGGMIFHENNTSGSVVLDAANGCDSTVNVSLNFFPEINSDFSTTICLGDTLFMGGRVFHENNTSGSIILDAANGCDSIVNVSLGFFPEISSDFATTICPRDTLSLGGIDFHQNNTTGSFVLDAANGCDSTVNVSLNFFSPTMSTLEPMVCPSDTFFLGGQAFFAGNETGQVVFENLDSNGCDSIVNVSLGFFVPIVNELNAGICAGDSLLIDGIWFHENHLSETIILENLTSNACDSIINVTVDILPNSVSNVSASICPGEVYEIGNLSLSNTGLFTVVFEDLAANGCDSIVELDLTVLNNPEFNINQTLCPGESLTIGNQTFDAATPDGQVIFENMAANGCDSIVNVMLSFEMAAQSTFEGDYCPGESVTIGGMTFDESTPSGTVILEDMSSNGCDSTVMVNLNFLEASFATLDSMLCFGENLQIGDQLFDASFTTGTVILENQAANGCDSTVMVTVSFFNQQSISLTGDQSICDGESADLLFDVVGNGTFEILIDPGMAPPFLVNDVTAGSVLTLNPTQTTTYTIFGATSNDNNCPVSVSGEAEISVSNLVANAQVTSQFGNFDVSCANTSDGVAEVQINGGFPPFNILWSDGNINAINNNLGVGTYGVSITDDAGCMQESEVTLNGPFPISIEASGENVGCFGQNNGLININTITGGTGPFEYSLDGEFFQTLTVPTILGGQSAGNYELVVQDGNDCSVTTTVLVPQIEELVMDLGDNMEISIGDSILLFPTTNFTPTQWEWKPLEGLNQPDTFFTYAAPEVTTTYLLELADENGCTISDIITVFVNANAPIYIPTGFSPDGDGQNDILYIFAGEGVEEITSFQIFDRWGNQVFADGPFPPNDPNFGWNGELNGQPMNAAVFVYFAEVLLSNGKTVLLEGDFVLLR